MRKQKEYFKFTPFVSVLFGIILPLAIGIKDLLLLGYLFASVWFIYALVRFITVFLISPALRIKEARRNGMTTVTLKLPRRDVEQTPHTPPTLKPPYAGPLEC